MFTDTGHEKHSFRAKEKTGQLLTVSPLFRQDHKKQQSGRDYEKSISIEYLSNLNDRYEQWIKDYKGRLLVIEADDLDFEHRPEDFAMVTDKIDAELFGLF